MIKKILLSLIGIFMILVAITVGVVFNREKINFNKNETKYNIDKSEYTEQENNITMKVTYTYNLHDESFDVEIVNKDLIDLINDNIFKQKLENCYDIDLSIQGNYKVDLGNNVYFSFDGYSEDGYVMITKDTKTFLTKIDSKILKQIIDIVDIKLTEKSKIFNTSLITIKNKEERQVTIDRKTAVEYLLNNCKYVYTKEINYEPNLVRPDYEIDFNNGTIILKYENQDKGYFLRDGVLGEIYCLNIMDEFLNIAINYMEERINMLDCNEITIVSPEKTVTIIDKYEIEKIVTPIIFSSITTPDWLKDYDIKEEYDKGIKVKINGYEFLIPGIKHIGNRYLIDKDGNLNLCFSIMNADRNIKKIIEGM